MPGTFPGSGSLPPPAPLPSSPAPPAPSPLSPSGLSGLAQLPGTPSQKPSTLAATPRQGTNELSYPFELTVFHARVHYWSGDPLGYVDALSRILAKCKEKAREEGRIVLKRKELGKAVKACGGGDVESTRSEHTSNGEDESEDGDREKGKEDAEKSTEGTEVQDEEEKESDEEGEESDEVLAAAEANLSMWLERVARVCLILASQMIEMNVGIPYHFFLALPPERPCHVASVSLTHCWSLRTTKRRSTCSPRSALIALHPPSCRHPLRHSTRPSHGSTSSPETSRKQRNTFPLPPLPLRTVPTGPTPSP